MATAAKKAAPAAPAKRTRTKREKPADGSFALKLRVEGVTDGHREGLATRLGVKPRKVTRTMLKDWLLEQAQSALNTLHVAGPAIPGLTATESAHVHARAQVNTEDDDLLG